MCVPVSTDITKNGIAPWHNFRHPKLYSKLPPARPRPPVHSPKPNTKQPHPPRNHNHNHNHTHKPYLHGSKTTAKSKKSKQQRKKERKKERKKKARKKCRAEN
jgi:hypothetical protein